MSSKTNKVRQPVQKRGIKTKNKIIEAGKKLFASQGYYRTNSKEIARKAGVATGTFYMYFHDKKTLFMEIYKLYYDEIINEVFNKDLISIFTEKNNKKIVHILIKRMSEAHKISPQFHRETISMLYSDKEVKKYNDEQEEKFIVFLIDFFKSHKDKFRIKDYEAGARLIYRSLKEIVHFIVIFDLKIDKNRIVKELNDMIYRYLFK